MTGPAPDGGSMSSESFRRSFYYGSRADMQFKYLASMEDEDAADGGVFPGEVFIRAVAHVVDAALELLSSATTPGTVVEFP